MSQTPHHRRGSVPKNTSPMMLVECNSNSKSYKEKSMNNDDGMDNGNSFVGKSKNDDEKVVLREVTSVIGTKESDIELGSTTVARVEEGEMDRKTGNGNKNGSYYLVILSLIFFVSTIVNNLVLEGASEIVTASPYKEALIGSASTLFQCACCFILPIPLDIVASINKKISSGGSSRGWLWRMSSKMTFSDLRPYLQLTVAVVFATQCANLSVAYVSYPTKVVLKSAKLIPTMIVSTFFFRHNKKNRRHYTTKDYMAATCLCIGAAGYSYDPSKKYNAVNNHTNNNDVTHSQYFGIALLTGSVIMDAFIPNLQQRLMSSTKSSAGYSKITASDLMINVNGIATIGTIIYMVLMEQSFTYVFFYCFTNTKYSMYMILNGFSQAIGIYAYTKLIQASGSVVAVTISTLRKVATITLSYIVFPGKPFLTVHFISASMVLIGIILQSFRNNKDKRIPHEKKTSN